MKDLRSSLLLAIVPLALASACDTSDEGRSTLGATTGAGDTDGSGSTSDGTLSTTITASSTDGSTTGSPTDSDPSTSGDPSASTTVATDPTTDGSTGDDEQAATVYELQDGTIAPGTAVTVQGVIVTAVRDEIGVFVQENQGGERSGIYVDTGDLDLTGFAVGDVVDVSGIVSEPTEGALEDLTLIDAANGGSVVDTGNDATATPVTVALSALGNPATAEPWEGVLITVDEDVDVTVVNETQFSEFVVSDGSDSILVDNFLYSIYDNEATFPNMGVNATFESVTGPLNYSFGEFKVAPRSAGDMAGYVPTQIAGASIDDMDPGDLIITELMYNPNVCVDTSCEYIEIFNNSGQDVNLDGLIINDGDGDSVTVSQPAVLAAGAYGIVGQTNWAYMDVSPLAQASLPAFNNGTTGDRASIANSTATIDSIPDYASPGNTDDGFAWKLNVAPDADDNDDVMNWCYAPMTFEGMDFGSPGEANNAGCSIL